MFDTIVSIFDTKQKIPSFFLNVSKVVLAFISPISHQKSITQQRTVNHLYKSNMFIGRLNLLNNCILIDLMIEVIQSIQMQKIIRFLAV